MRTHLFILPLALFASPAFAQPQVQPQAPSPQFQVPPELTDPQMAARLGRISQVLGKALLDMPVGEIEAAAEGRQPTAADRRRTVRSEGRARDPNFERNLDRQLAESGPMFEAAMRAFATALPAMMQGMEQAGRALEAATENLPPPPAPNR